MDKKIKNTRLFLLVFIALLVFVTVLGEPLKQKYEPVIKGPMIAGPPLPGQAMDSEAARDVSYSSAEDG
ncbi:MAG: hypothetical protein COZ32_04530, partial [Nitrospirae bacterium CG_4_10_14_3_um_filter_53_41]